MAIGGGAIVPIQSSLGNVRFNLNDVSPDGSELLATAVNNNDENGKGGSRISNTTGEVS
jgi:hypothetical protein